MNCFFQSLFLYFITGLVSQIQVQAVITFNASNTAIVRDHISGINFGNFVKKTFQILNVEPVEIFQVKSAKTCLINCVKNVQCVSCNVASLPDPNGQYQCEILGTDRFKVPQNLTNNQTFHHFGIRFECNSTSCGKNGVCVFLNDDSYECKCTLPYHGTNCDIRYEDPLGVEDGRIPDSQITASSSNRAALYGRLNKVKGGWNSGDVQEGEWLQIDLGALMIVTKVATQGRDSPNYEQFTKSYKLAYKFPGGALRFYEQGKVFVGNTDKQTVVTHSLQVPIKSQYVRFIVVTYVIRPALRVELYGCPL